MGRNYLKGIQGNWINTILSACGYNLKKIYNKLRKTFLEIFSLVFLVLFGVDEGRNRCYGCCVLSSR
jgi:hypothetical protein